MALSDLLLRLASRTEDLENSVAALRSNDETKLAERAGELRDSLSQIRSALVRKVDAEADASVTRWVELQRAVADGFEVLRDAATYATDPALRAEADAAQAELEAEDAVDFAVHALQEAEYYVLVALAARDAADEVEQDEQEVADTSVILTPDGDEEPDSTDVDVTVATGVALDAAVASNHDAATDVVPAGDSSTVVEGAIAPEAAAPDVADADVQSN